MHRRKIPKNGNKPFNNNENENNNGNQYDNREKVRVMAFSAVESHFGMVKKKSVF